VTTPLTYSVEGAAARLGGSFTLDEIPHIKAGNGRGRAGRISFSEAHLVQIIDMFTVRPAAAGPEPEFPSMATRRSRRAS
jgi:hypothetical protein